MASSHHPLPGRRRERQAAAERQDGSAVTAVSGGNATVVARGTQNPEIPSSGGLHGRNIGTWYHQNENRTKSTYPAGGRNGTVPTGGEQVVVQENLVRNGSTVSPL